MTTLVSLAFAAAMGFLVWRMARDERRRSDARVAALIASLDADGPLDWTPASTSEPETDPDDAVSAPVPTVAEATHVGPFSALFSAAGDDDDAPGVRQLVAIGLVICVLVGGAAIVWTTVTAIAPAAPSRAEAVPQPLELLSLTSTRRGPELLIAGLVRNPRVAARVEQVTAVVLFFDDRGSFLTSSRAPLEVQTLEPGDESPFQLTLAAPEGTSRYRVSFRRAEGGVVPHVDRRVVRDGASAPTGPPGVRRTGL